jgi:hypothetical protein
VTFRLQNKVGFKQQKIATVVDYSSQISDNAAAVAR